MKPIFNKAPLTPNALSPLAPGSVRPEGWLAETLQAQAEGLNAQFLRLWPETVNTGKWVAGPDGDWDYIPYILEGVVSVGWALNNTNLKNIAGRIVDAMIASQTEDGWFGPEENAEYWPLIHALRALKLYFMASNDKRVLVLMDKFFKYEYANLQTRPFQEYAVARGAENMEVALWMYNITGQKYLLELCRRMRGQTLDWPNYFHTFSTNIPMGKSQKWERLREALQEERNEPMVGEQRPYFHSQFHYSDGVNIAMGLKCPGVIDMFKSGFKEHGGFGFGWEKLTRFHGTANGMFTCDGHINGQNPSQGTRLQAVVEMLNTMETLMGIGDCGGENAADIFEKIAYNALPAAFTPDMLHYQRVQQTNQIRVSKDERKWYSYDSEANLFRGAEINPDCASVQQAWAKVLQHQWYATQDGGISAASYAPCSVRFAPEGIPVRVNISGGYPFAHTINIEVSTKQPVEFPLYLRIPFWARQSMIYLPNGEIMQVRSGEATCVRRVWSDGDSLRLELPATPRMSYWYHQSGTVEVGPLVMSLKPEVKWEDRPEGLCASTDEKWGYAILRDTNMKLISEPDDITAFGIGESAISVVVKAAAIDWKNDNINCGSIPMAPRFGKDLLDVLELVPYGDASLRITEFPLGAVREEKQKEIK